ncbi:MAG: HK97 family phage prohead protease [bacterium]|nr:HK97 family phage prohead protease [bacterium]
MKEKERRYFKTPVEVRADGDKEGLVEGVAAVVEQVTDLYFYEEKIARGAFDDVLGDDVVALKNHDPNFVLARTSSGTLELFITDGGDLGYRYNTPMGRQHAVDLLDEIRTGDVSQSSFAFTIKEETWEFATRENGLEKDRRTIKKFERLYDVSPVTYPAYSETSVSARSYEEAKKEFEQAQNKVSEDQTKRDKDLRELSKINL